MRKLSSIIAERERLDADDRDLRSRTDAKEERVAVETALADLAKALVETKPQWLEQLDLPESLFDAISDARLIKSAIARNRQMRIVRRELRDGDWQRIRTLLAELEEHGTLLSEGRPTLPASDEAIWTLRLLRDGPPALDAFVKAYPQADRTRLRQLVRNIEKAPQARRPQAERKLSEALRPLFPHDPS